MHITPVERTRNVWIQCIVIINTMMNSVKGQELNTYNKWANSHQSYNKMAEGVTGINASDDEDAWSRAEAAHATDQVYALRLQNKLRGQD